MGSYKIECLKYAGPDLGYQVIIEPSLGPQEKAELAEHPNTKNLIPRLITYPFGDVRNSFDKIQLMGTELKDAKGDVNQTLQNIMNSVAGRFTAVLQTAGVEVELNLFEG